MSHEAADPEVPLSLDSDRSQQAARTVEHYTLWSGGAGLIPLPFVDVAAISAVQLQMLRKLAAIYGVRFSDNLGKSVLATLLGSLIPATSGMGFVSAVKSVPIVGTAVAITAMPALAAGATYVIGQVFSHHFASGGTLLDFDPPDYREFIKAHTDKLKAKLDGLDVPGQSSSPQVSAPQERQKSGTN